MIDDGSTDRTVEVARAVRRPPRRQPRRQPGAGPGVHDRDRGEPACRAPTSSSTPTPTTSTSGADIGKLVAPVLDGDADVVVGTRPLSSISTFSPIKKALQHLGTHAVRVLSGTEVRDATSGFRAFSREAALRLQVHGQYTYTLETIIQVGAEGLTLKAVPIGVNPQSRPSRLVKSSFDYVRKSIPTIVRSYARYRPLRFFTWLAAVPGLVGVALVVRWFILRFDGDDASRVPEPRRRRGRAC